ncbi:MAG: UDP-N-acetylmuramate dehydrogenase [Bacilli bacterium]|nr:UDP-N-acetylmuramate dehydrogenase [Bacilli bacterium]
MNKEDIINLNVGEVLFDVDLTKYNTYRISSLASVLVEVDSISSLIKLLVYIKSNNLKYMILGTGSNIIFDGNYEGIIIRLSKLNNVEITNSDVIVEAGYNLTKLANLTANLGLEGLEWAVGIPGTVGGAIYMNAGAYKKAMNDNVFYVEVLNENLEIKRLYLKDLEFGYRSSVLQKYKNYTVIKVALSLKFGNKEELLQIIDDRRKRRIETQPLDFPNAGSVFRNPGDLFAWKLIEDAGLKGYASKWC